MILLTHLFTHPSHKYIYIFFWRQGLTIYSELTSNFQVSCLSMLGAVHRCILSTFCSRTEYCLPFKWLKLGPMQWALCQKAISSHNLIHSAQEETLGKSSLEILFKLHTTATSTSQLDFHPSKSPIVQKHRSELTHTNTHTIVPYCSVRVHQFKSFSAYARRPSGCFLLLSLGCNRQLHSLGRGSL